MPHASLTHTGSRVGAFVTGLLCHLKGLVTRVAVAMVALAAMASAASAETLLMPNRDYLMGASEVVWGITTQANGTAFTLNYGDGQQTTGNVTDRSYIAFNHTYALAGTFTVTLTVGAETATATVRVFDGAAITAAELRGLNINRAIENGLRNLWVTQSARTTFDTVPQTNWATGWPRVATSLVVAAFQNHGYKLPNNASAPTGIFAKYAVQRGMNYLVANLGQVSLTTQTAALNNPCVGPGIEAAPCVGLSNSDASPGYGTAIVAGTLAGSSALSRTVPAGLSGTSGVYVAGKTLGEVLQRVINTVAWGQIDSGCIGRGAWTYSLINNSCTTSDGSTVGWDMLGLLDAEAGGITVPAFVKTEFAFALASMGNTNGSFDYNGDGNPATNNTVNLAKAGIYLQGLFYSGVPLADARVQAAIGFINARWSGTALTGDYTGTCGFTLQNKGCAYGMYNAFKGLKLYGVNSLAAASDWYAEYQDYLVATQTNPTTTAGGNWGAMQFSCCAGTVPSFNTAIAELILAPVALIAPDPTLFASVGLSPATATNPVGTTHTVTAFAQATNGAPIPGATVVFKVLPGSINSAVPQGTGTTGADGKTSFTYTSNGSVGSDTIQAFIGNLGSNVVSKTWVNPTIVCDVNGDGKVTTADLLLIRAKNGQAASGANDPFDPNGDGVINVADVRYCQLRLTPP